MLEASGLRVSYPVPRPGLRAGSARANSWRCRAPTSRIAPGETLGVVGESGSGKSTLALAALGLLQHEGSWRVGGRQWGAGGAATARCGGVMQVVFQDPFSSLSPRMTVEQIVGEGLTVHAPDSTAARAARGSLEALADVGPDRGAVPGRCSTAIRTSSPAASGSAWRSRGR